MLDSVESNDTCLEALAKRFPMDFSRRRLRCIGHIINLVVRAVIFGSNVSKFEAELCGARMNSVSRFGPRRGPLANPATLLPVSVGRTSDGRRFGVYSLSLQGTMQYLHWR